MLAFINSPFIFYPLLAVNIMSIPAILYLLPKQIRGEKDNSYYIGALLAHIVTFFVLMVFVGKYLHVIKESLTYLTIYSSQKPNSESLNFRGFFQLFTVCIPYAMIGLYFKLFATRNISFIIGSLLVVIGVSLTLFSSLFVLVVGSFYIGLLLVPFLLIIRNRLAKSLYLFTYLIGYKMLVSLILSKDTSALPSLIIYAN